MKYVYPFFSSILGLYLTFFARFSTHIVVYIALHSIILYDSCGDNDRTLKAVFDTLEWVNINCLSIPNFLGARGAPLIALALRRHERAVCTCVCERRMEIVGPLRGGQTRGLGHVAGKSAVVSATFLRRVLDLRALSRDLSNTYSSTHTHTHTRRGHLVRAIQEPCSTQRPMPTAKQLSGCMEESRCRSAQREYIPTSRGPESAGFSFSASTLHQDSLRGNFPPSLPTSPRRPAAEGPLLLRGTSTHGRRSGDVGRLDRGRPSCSTRSVYWWTAEIADLRRSCLRARRLFQRSRSRHDEETHSANYASARRLLHVAIKTSKRRCWRQLCDKVNNDVWGKPYRIAMSRLGCPQAKQPSSPLLVRGAVAALFPRVPSGPALRLPRRAEEPIPAVTLEELKGAQSRIKERSAPGPDGNSALKIAIAARPDIFLRVYTMCLETGVFPSGWKRQRLVLLPKPGKPPDEPSSYRPLCMLDTAGKILERIICDRLEAFTERPGGSRSDSMASGKGDQR
ncbi:unnamed protein product [Trichogramma brassicae]|uniref:Reverse transcriptase domain-containing protein n=1 Tax=Trichogramma brassicae TaxID=86971 RepID=A0A6H5IXL3_9HYME|nr:unnamed protein product [Trichogramma brassicae]